METKKYTLVLLSISLLVCFWLPPFVAADDASPQGQETPAPEQVTPPPGQAATPPPGQAKAAEESIVERAGGYIHPFLQLSEMYNDNVFAVKNGAQQDYATTVSPGIWLAAPRMKQQLLDIATSTVTPGAATLTRFISPSATTYQTYLLYRGDFQRYDKFTGLNTDSHKVDGVFDYNFPSGLSIDMRDEFMKNHTILGIGASATQDTYNANLVNPVLSYDTGNKILLRADYANYIINYNSPTDKFKNRTDNEASAYVFYKVQPKTSLFTEFDFVDVRYEKNILVNNQEYHAYLGFVHQVTAKSQISVKAGADVKDFASSALSNTTDFTLEAQVQYLLTPKSSISFTYGRKTNESDIDVAGYVLEDSVTASYGYKMNDKLSGGLSIWFANEQYKGTPVTEDGETKLRRDTYYRVGPSVEYRFREWLRASLGYSYTKRDSDFPSFGYGNNIVSLTLKGSL